MPRPLLLSHHIALLRLFSLLPKLLDSLRSFVSLSQGRWTANGLFEAIHNFLIASAPVPASSSNPVKHGGGSLRADADSPEAISDSDRSSLASDYWSQIWKNAPV